MLHTITNKEHWVPITKNTKKKCKPESAKCALIVFVLQRLKAFLLENNGPRSVLRIHHHSCRQQWMQLSLFQESITKNCNLQVQWNSWQKYRKGVFSLRLQIEAKKGHIYPVPQFLINYWRSYEYGACERVYCNAMFISTHITVVCWMFQNNVVFYPNYVKRCNIFHLFLRISISIKVKWQILISAILNCPPSLFQLTCQEEECEQLHKIWVTDT